MRLVLELPDSDTDVWHYALINDAQALVRHDFCTLDLLPASTDLIAVVPASRCAWHRVNLPKTPAARLRLALDGALEERLLDDTQDTHLAVLDDAKPASDGGIWVFACQKPWLVSRLTALQEAGRGATHLTTQSIPGEAAEARIGGDETSLCVTYCGPAGAWTMPLGGVIHSNLVPDADSTRWVSPPNLAANAETLLGRKVAVESWAVALAACAKSSALSRGNLAQFELSRFTASGVVQRLQKWLHELCFATQWRPFRVGVAMLVVANVVGIQVLAHQQEAALSAKRRAAYDSLTQIFPDVKVVIDAPVQMQRQLDLLRRSKGSLGAGDFESQMNAWAQVSAAAGVPSANGPTAIEFDGSGLSLKGVRVADVAAATRAMQGFGLDAVFEVDTVRIKVAGSGQP